MTYRDNPEIAKEYKSKRWQKFRRMYFISANGLCERCKKKRNNKTSSNITSHYLYNRQELSRR
jgi:5-methylcytosine-specific restriction endonuclease McrA